MKISYAITVCNELEEIILSTTVGVYLKGFQTKMQQFGKSMINDLLTDENRSKWIDDLKKGGGLNKVLDEIKQAFAEPIYGQPHFVHKMTGPAIWTIGILKGLNINVKNLIDDFYKIRKNNTKIKLRQII